MLEHKICCIIGHPVAHSLSPIMHNTAYKALGLNYIFLPFDVTDLKSAVTSIKNLGIVGCAVTVPHKIKVMKYLDKIDETAKKIGAVNTIINLKGTLTGLNTDWSGALDALKEKTELAGKNVALIGAGGAARAIAYGLKQEAAYVTVFNRNKGHGKELVKDLHLDSYIPLKESTKLDGFDIVINAISVGLESRQSPLTKKSLNQKQVVFDIVYFPRMTRFLKAAKEVGCSIITGDRMLLHCVKRQFELFTGKRIPVEILEDAIC
ncbi:shikimate dehydrogenase [Candidatus Gottesmanbacteria bacterium RIFCSPLOWO2_01_FULL_39_12b]|uniref:Shikimate dehydrogenase (NADP(+)) n=1 Tax=Candidatus Gottesmanbacteria bacterium RIFCSPLOWO2_01_FULL_39_12b TaxID=1798388 RepID=A0A1F6AS58_9BACT|nr:MAG: shikimate dehydrogenase [Candidatus Gottesmanbacteria bacterium RIFCSPLOWO2_01_FULL_39_12b]